MCPFSWPSLWGRGMKNSLMSAVGLLFISCSFFRLLLSSISIIDGLFCGTGTAAWVRVGFDFFDFGVRSWPSILVSLSMVMGQAWGLLVVATGQSGKGDEPTPEFVGINISVGVDDPWTVAELGGTVQVRLGTKSLASLIYFAGRHMVRAGQVDIVMVYRAVKDCLLLCSTWWICEPMSQCQNNGEWVWWFKCKDLLTFCNWLQLEPMQVNLITMATIGVMLVRFDSQTRYLNVSLSWCELSVVLQMAWAEVFLIYQIKLLKIWKYLGR